MASAQSLALQQNVGKQGRGTPMRLRFEIVRLLLKEDAGKMAPLRGKFKGRWACLAGEGMGSIS